MNIARRAIAHYWAHLSEDSRQELQRLLAAADTEELLVTLLDMLSSGDRQDRSDAGFVIRDLMMTEQYGIGQEFRDRFHDSALVHRLEQQLTADNPEQRRDAVYTLGKSGCLESLPALRAAVEHFTQNDPLNLPLLIQEVCHLESRESDLPLRLAAHEHYLVRWAALNSTNSQSDIGVRISTMLREDPHPLVRAEAEYLYQGQCWQRDMDLFDKTEHKAERKRRVAAGLLREPAITFGHIRIGFQRFMDDNRMSDYSLHQLEDFVENLIEPRT